MMSWKMIRRELLVRKPLLVLASLSVSGAAMAASATPPIDANDIGGVVRGAKGPEAGVWVIAEADNAQNPLVKIVVTDDDGRFVIPNLPAGNYKVWVRGYGLVDSEPVKGAPGASLTLAAVTAPDAAAAAAIYPANYWASLIKFPDAKEFPGTGPKGNGINPQYTTQQHWVAHFKENCHGCHQLGNKPTRELADAGDITSVEAWDQRIRKNRNNAASGGEGSAARPSGGNTAMTNFMTMFGRERGLHQFAQWTDDIKAGKIPAEAPPRPRGVERNVVITLWNWAGGRWVHDTISTDKRNPTVNAGGPVYGAGTRGGSIVVLDPVSNQADEIAVPGLLPGGKVSGHTPTIDSKGRVWLTAVFGEGEPTPYCTDGQANKFAKYFPPDRFAGKQVAHTRRVSLYNPADKEIKTLPVCFESHHLNFGTTKDNVLYMSGDTEVVGWINTRVYDETKDIRAAQGWCPMVLDTNGDGKITPDRTQWNSPKQLDIMVGNGIPGSATQVADPNKDSRISGFLYGIGVSPVDESVWAVKWTPILPSGIVRMELGKSPPETCMTQYYEPPRAKDGTYAAFNARGVDVDGNGIAWAAFNSGHLGKFDRNKCSTKRIPITDPGQQCPEGWTMIDPPGPRFPGLKSVGTDSYYLIYTDIHGAAGLGKNVPILTGTNSDSLLAYLPEKSEWVVLRTPYPQGFYARSLDARIDDPKTGRGSLWSNYASSAGWHVEGGEYEDVSHVIRFEVRESPLAR